MVKVQSAKAIKHKRTELSNLCNVLDRKYPLFSQSNSSKTIQITLPVFLGKKKNGKLHWSKILGTRTGLQLFSLAKPAILRFWGRSYCFAFCASVIFKCGLLKVLLMQGSILPVTIPPPGHTPGDLQFFSYLAVYSPPPGTQKETIPDPRDSSSTTNTLFCVQNWFPYNSTTRRFDKNLNAFLEFTERRTLHSIKKHGHYIEKENWRKSLTALAFGWRVTKCSSPRVFF